MKTEKGELALSVSFLTLDTSHGLSNLRFYFLAIVVSIYEEPTTPQQAANVVEKLGEYLMSHGY